MNRDDVVMVDMRQNGRDPSPAWVPPQAGTLSGLLATLGVPQACPSDCDAVPVALWRFPQHATLLHEGSCGRSIYVVRHGYFKRLKTLEDGYEQVLGFMQPGEMLGFEALNGSAYSASFVALEAASVYVVPIADLADLNLRCPALGAALQRTLSLQLMHATDALEMMAAVSSEVRVARFVMWWSSRMAALGQSTVRLRLRMCRRDIASLLGVAHETVSRSLTSLSEEGLLAVRNRDVEILDMKGLQARASSTRSPAHADGERPPAPREQRPLQPATADPSAIEEWA